MTKRAKKRQPTQTPPEWIEMFIAHDQELMRVRMLWRRGGGIYRPVVPINLALEDLEEADFEVWEDLELPETHFDWAVVEDISPEQRNRQVEDLARELWSVAVLWTRAKGPVCDFQIRGYGSGDGILFEDGKRCNLSGEQSRYEDETRERAPVDEAIRRMIGDERAAWLQLDQTKDSLINRLNDDRERLFGHIYRVTKTAPEMIDNAHGILDRAIKFQQRQFETYLSRAGGQRELEARAHAEEEKTKRIHAVVNLFGDMGQAVVAAAPTLQGALEDMFTGSQTLPKFEESQQAMMYLHLSLERERLARCFSGSTEARLSSADRALAEMKRLGKAASELAAIHEGMALVTQLFKTRVFREISTKQELYAAQFVMGRAAIFRVGTVDYESV